MKEQTALNKGYIRTGMYARSQEKVQERLKEIKAQGYKAVIVTIPDSKYSRGIISEGYCIFCEERYMLDKAIAQINLNLAEIEERKARAYEQYLRELSKIDQDQAQMEEHLNELQQRRLAK